MIASLARPLFAFAVASTLTLFAGVGEASTFSAWQVAHVPWGDTLNVRAYPSARSRMQAAYPQWNAPADDRTLHRRRRPV